MAEADVKGGSENAADSVSFRSFVFLILERAPVGAFWWAEQGFSAICAFWRNKPSGELDELMRRGWANRVHRSNAETIAARRDDIV